MTLSESARLPGNKISHKILAFGFGFGLLLGRSAEEPPPSCGHSRTLFMPQFPA